MANSPACITGSEAITLGYELIQSGRSKRVLCGSTEGDGKYIWGGFDAMRILSSKDNDHPERASRPMSHDPQGFVPSGGAGALVLEDLDAALERDATIYAEIKGAYFNSGGQRNGGTMTAPNSEAVVECIRRCMEQSDESPSEIDLISGHLTSTKGDVIEVHNWSKALGFEKDSFPFINTPKSMIGHCIGGAGSVELVACILQMRDNYVHANLNLDHVHPEISSRIPEDKMPLKRVDTEINTIIKSNFGFGDLNCVVLLKKWKP
jgi:3-oxoacyl-(acyl-carrier-protein) synthase